jgi:hypothetical protein
MEPPPASLNDAAIGKTRAKGKITRWFNHNPLVGPVTFLLGVLSFGATVYFGVAGFKTKELSLYVNPSKTTIVKSGQSSDLHVLYRGKDVSTDVTALQVELWNAGKESIRPEHVLSPITLETSPKVPILEARIRHVSRPFTQIVVDQTQIADGKVTVSWKILEHNDAAVIQFILAGPTETSIRPSGSLEGQPTLSVHQSAIQRSSWFKIVYVLLVFASVIPMTMTLNWIVSKVSDVPLSASSIIKSGPLIGAVILVGVPAVAVLKYYFGEPTLPLPFN